MSAVKQLAACVALALLTLAALGPAAAQADFGIKSLETASLNENGTADLQAGSHPFEFETSITMNQDGEENPEGILRDLIVELPPGLVGNPQAVPRCSGADFDGLFPRCPGDTQIGVARINIPVFPTYHTPVYNLTPSFGVPATIGFSAINLNSFQEASLRTGSDYGVNISDITLPTDLQIQSVSETIWGVPKAKSHDPERICISPTGGQNIEGCSSNAPEEAPFLSLPTACGAPLRTTVKVDSLAEPGNFQEESAELRGEDGEPEGLNGCEAPIFNPTLVAQSESAAADSPTGLHVGIHIHQSKSVSPEATATAHLKDVVLRLPKGMAVNPSAGDGRGACTPAQIGLKSAAGETPIEFTPGPAQCPDNAKVGTVTAKSPLLDHSVSGSLYLAAQGENPFGSLLALYLAIDDPQTGVVVKLAGKVEPDPVTGQLRTSFKENPQLPIEDVSVDLFGGPRAALTTPQTCGTYATTSQLTPWTTPKGKDASPGDSFAISSGAGGGGCVGSEAELPNAPSFEAGTVTSLAGAFSPFVMKLSRENGSQRLGALNLTLPPGVSAKLAGVTECSEPEIAAAVGRFNPGEGALERQIPSCPQSSEVGTVNVGAGSGNPLFVQGHAYLAGPYKGAPLSLAIITPAIAGPFDLGTVVVRAALQVNDSTAQVSVKSDPLPTILQGIPLDLRSIAVKIDRPEFSLNPTSCEEKSITGEAISTTGAAAVLRNRFQVGGCRGLDYTPKLALSMKGATKRSGHPAFKAVLTQPPNQANSRRVSVALPPTVFIDQSHISNPCTRAQFSENKCPAASVLGTARAFTPLLDKPLEGSVYFRSNGGERELPDIVVDLNGQVHFVLVGFVDALHHKGSESSRVRNTFAAAPDAPVSKFVLSLRGGKKGLLENSANICKTSNIAIVKMSAQNNKAHDFNEPIATSCPKH